VTRWRPVSTSLCALLLIGCAGSGPLERAQPADEAQRSDFSGHWELDYGRSDNVQAQLTALVRQLNRDARRRSSQPGGDRPGSIALGDAGTNSAPSILGLAQMADMITQSQLLEIDQSRSDIRVKREGNFALTCDFALAGYTLDDLGVGREACGWDGDHLLFIIQLPGGLTIQHRLALANTRDTLGIATTLRSDRVSAPFTVHRVYRKYDPADTPWRCEMTVSRGRVCTTEDPE
jgi:hypothetical protein